MLPQLRKGANFPWFKFCLPIVFGYMSLKLWKIKFKPGIKLKHNIHFIIYKTNTKIKTNFV